MELDVMLRDLGQFGRFQAFYFCLLLFPVMLCSFRSTEYVFTTMDVPHRCRIPECEGICGPTQFSPPWLSSAVPMTGDGAPTACLRYLPLENVPEENTSCCSAELFISNVTVTCDVWVFADQARTIARDFGILCPEDYWKRTLIGSLTVLASVVSLPLIGLLSDGYGRKTVLLAGCATISITGVLRSFSPSYSILAALEIFDGFVIGTTYDPAYLLGLESLAPSKRLLGGMLINTFYSMGEVVLALDMWLVEDWRIMQRIFYIPMMAIIVALYWLLPESVRWLYTHKRFDDIGNIFNKIAKANNTENKIPDIKQKLQVSVINGLKHERADETQASVRMVPLRAVFKSRTIMWRVVVCALCWAASSFTTSGISLTATHFKGNRYVTFVLVSLVEVPSSVVSLWLPDWKPLGRRGCLVWSFFLTAIIFLSISWIHSDRVWLNLCLALLSKFLSSLTFTVAYLYVTEICPTQLRHSLLSVCSMVASIGIVIAQQMPLAERFIDPMLVFAGVSMVGGALSLTCPETLGTTLPDTIQEAEDIGRPSCKMTIEQNIC